jgi:hypothetical protein
MLLMTAGIRLILVYEHWREKTCFKYNYFSDIFQMRNLHCFPGNFVYYSSTLINSGKTAYNQVNPILKQPANTDGKAFFGPVWDNGLCFTKRLCS